MTEKQNLNAETADLVKYIMEKCEIFDFPVALADFCREYADFSGLQKPIYVWKDRIKSYRQRIHTLENLDTRTKVKQLFVLSAHLNEDFLKELRKTAHVEVDAKNRLTKYEDGSFLLEGDHSQSTKSKIGWNARRRREKRKIEETIQGMKVKKEPLDDGLLEPKKEEIEEEDSRNLVEILGNFQIFLLNLNLKNLESVRENLEKIIEETRKKNPKIASDTIRIAVESCLLLATKTTEPDSEGIDLNHFLQIFQQFLYSLLLPNDFLFKITEKILEFSFEDKKIPIEMVKTAVETTLLLLK